MKKYICIFVLAWVWTAQAAVLQVGPGGYPSIQAAIEASINGDTIEVAPSTYYGNIDFLGKAITVTSTDPDDPNVVAATIIDSQGSLEHPGRGFYFHTGEGLDSVIDGFTITGGSGSYEGGGILCWGASPTIRNCIIRNNRTIDHGGGICCRGNANPLIYNCLITENSFDTYGYGGGIYCYTSNPAIINCTITKNHALGRARHGGGICCWGDGVVSSDPLVVNCIVSGNSAGQRGGGLYAYWSNPMFVNCTVIGNLAEQGGGVGSFREANPQVINCIVRDNIAQYGNQLALINTISVWPIALPTSMTVSHSDIQGGQAAAYIQQDCTLIWQTGNIDADPNFVDPGLWRYPQANPQDPNDDFFLPGNYHITPQSPCIDAGDNSLVSEISDYDIDGEERIFNGTVDMGADELITNLVDFNTDGIVDLLDLLVLTQSWLSDGPGLEGDLTGDDRIDTSDFAAFSKGWFWTAGWYE